MNDRLSFIRRLLPNDVTQKLGRQILKIEKNSPHILFGAGIVGFAGTVILASRATLKVEEVLDAAQKDLKNINEVQSNAELVEKSGYSSEDAIKDRIYVYSRTTIGLVQLYTPTVLVGTFAIACLTKSHAILSERNAALTLAYASLDQAFKEYRKRVSEQLDPEYERDIYFDAQKVEVDIIDPDTNKKETIPSGFKMIGDRAYSRYARFFDQLCPDWNKVPEYNYIFLRAQQNYANDLLHSRGHVFLNEIYDMIGVPRTREGAVVGWVISKNGGDNYIDFGFMDSDNPRARDFVNGREGAILLDFNVDGLIYDKI